MPSRPFIQFKTIMPKKGFLFDAFEKEIRDSMTSEANPELRTEFYKTVDSWETPVYFRGTIRTIPGKSITLTVAPYGSGKELYQLVARGARPHVIEPRRAEYLRFQRGYRSATRVRWIGSRRKQRFGDTVMTQHVNHPGFEARNWDYEIAEQYTPRFIQLMNEAVHRYKVKQSIAFNESQTTDEASPVQR